MNNYKDFHKYKKFMHKRSGFSYFSEQKKKLNDEKEASFMLNGVYSILANI